MKSTIRNNMRNASFENASAQSSKPYSQRRLKTKPVLAVIAILLAGNIFWFILWFSSSSNPNENEQVASIDGESITKQQWMAEMEGLYGKETLRNLVNEAVAEKAASKYDIDVSDSEIDMELALMSSAQDDTALQNLSTDQLRQKVRAQLILDKVLTKDIVIDEEKVKAYYDENVAFFNTKKTYRTSLIVVNSEDEAKSVLKELENGSTFSVLARERSLDSASANLGGDIGFISEGEDSVDTAITTALAKMSKDDTSEPFVMSDGRYGIVHVSDVLEGQSFTYEDVKDHIQRELALEQIPQNVSIESLWSEFDVSWFYSK